MFIGHFAPAFVAATHPRAPSLPVLFVAAQLADLGFFTLALAGVERLRIVPGMTAMNGLDLYHMPYTHSLLGMAVLAAITFWLFWAFAREARAGDGNGTTIVVWGRQASPGNGTTVVFWPRAAMAGALAGAVVLSHWFLDVLVHRPDMTLLGSPPKLGLGLWNHPMIEIPLELALFIGSFLLWRKSKGALSGKAGWMLLLVMLAVQLYNWIAPEPAGYSAALPIMALAAFGLFIWLAARAEHSARLSDPGLANPPASR